MYFSFIKLLSSTASAVSVAKEPIINALHVVPLTITAELLWNHKFKQSKLNMWQFQLRNWPWNRRRQRPRRLNAWHCGQPSKRVNRLHPAEAFEWETIECRHRQWSQFLIDFQWAVLWLDRRCYRPWQRCERRWLHRKQRRNCWSDFRILHSFVQPQKWFLFWPRLFHPTPVKNRHLLEISSWETSFDLRLDRWYDDITSSFDEVATEWTGSGDSSTEKRLEPVWTYGQKDQSVPNERAIVCDSSSEKNQILCRNNGRYQQQNPRCHSWSFYDEINSFNQWKPISF